MTEAVGASGESAAVPPPVVEKPRWRVRSPSGRVIAFRELTSMQKWIVERKFGRDDEISLHGDHWKRLGDIAELQPFFHLLDEVDRVHQLEDRLRRAELPDEAPSALEDALGLAVARAPPVTDACPRPDPARDAHRRRHRAPAAGPALPRRRPLRRPSAPSAGRVPGRPPPILGPRRLTGRPAPPRPRPSPSRRSARPPGPRRTTSRCRRARSSPGAARGRGAAASSPAGPASASTPRWRMTRTPGSRRFRSSKAPWVATILVVARPSEPRPPPTSRSGSRRRRRSCGKRPSASASRRRRRRTTPPGSEVRERERQAKEELVAGMAGPGGRRHRRSAAGGTGGSDTGPRRSRPPDPPSLRAEQPSRRAEPSSPEVPRRRSRRAPLVAAMPGHAASTSGWPGQTASGNARAPGPRWTPTARRAGRTLRPEAYVGQGRALLDPGQIPGPPTAAFRKALGVNSRYSVAEYWLGEAYRRAGQAADAEAAYGRYLEAAPEGAEAAQAREALNSASRSGAEG